MNKRFLLVVVSVLFCILSIGTALAAVSFPQGNFVLSGGKLRVMDEADPFEKMDKIFFASFTVPVKDGRINFSTGQPVDLISGSQHFKGTIYLSLSGNYDKETGTIKATFAQSTAITYERKTGSGIRLGEGESSFVGKASGTVINDQIVLSFDGKLSSRSSSEANDKSVDTNSTSSLAWTKKVAFGTGEWTDSAAVVQAEQPSDDSGVRFSDLSGQIEMWCPPHEGAWDVVKMHTIIRTDCHIKTGEDSSAVLSFPDMTTFRMKPETEIVLDTPPQKDSKMKLLAGNIWANVKKMVKDGTMENHMSQAVAGIKGTTYILDENDGTSTLKVLEGTVSFRSLATGKTVMVTDNETVTATSDGLSSVASFTPSEEESRWLAEVADVANTSTPSAERNKTIYYAIGGAIGLVAMVATILFVRRKKHSA